MKKPIEFWIDNKNFQFMSLFLNLYYDIMTKFMNNIYFKWSIFQQEKIFIKKWMREGGIMLTNLLEKIF